MLPASNIFTMKLECQNKGMYHRLRVAITVGFSDLILQHYKDFSKVEPREAVEALADEICIDLLPLLRAGAIV
jgi:hypothetical protein